MAGFLDPRPNASAHARACAKKHHEIATSIAALPPSYHEPLTSTDSAVLELSLPALVDAAQHGKLASGEIMQAYGKNALKAQERTHCLSDVFFGEAEATAARRWWDVGEGERDARARTRPLLGVPVSIKDTIALAGHDSTIGYSSLAGRPARTSSPLVHLLHAAGALVHCKTTVPIGLIALETATSLFSPTPTSTPYDPRFSAGASGGGGGALAGSRGCVVEVGSDVAGSVRLPAHACGVFGLKPSAGRLPGGGAVGVGGGGSSMPGMEGVPLVLGPIAPRLEDMAAWMERVVGMRPWEYDSSCVPLPWRDVDLQVEGRKLKWGVVWEDGIIAPTPACARALRLVITALKKQGHEVVDFSPPDVFEGLKVGYQLMFSDGGAQITTPLSRGESLSPPSAALLSLLALPRWVKSILAFLTRSSDPLSAQLMQVLHKKTVLEERANIVKRDQYRERWAERWREEGLDFVLTVPTALPPLKHGDSEKTSLIAAGYTFLFSLLDYTAAVMPVTHVDKDKDALPADFFPEPTSFLTILTTLLAPISSMFSLFSLAFSPASQSKPLKPTLMPTKPALHPDYARLSTIAKKAYTAYDAEEMHGLPLGVQVVGRRFEEEKVLQGMAVVQDALRKMGEGFVRPDFASEP